MPSSTDEGYVPLKVGLPTRGSRIYCYRVIHPTDGQTQRLDRMGPVLALFAAILTAVVVLVSGYFFLLVLPLALIGGLTLATRGGWMRWTGCGMIGGCLLVFLGVLINYD